MFLVRAQSTSINSCQLATIFLLMLCTGSDENIRSGFYFIHDFERMIVDFDGRCKCKHIQFIYNLK